MNISLEDDHVEAVHRDARRISWYPVFLWAAFWVIICSLYWINFKDSNMSRSGVSNAPVDERVSTQMMLMGRYSMGAKSVYSDIPGMQSDLLSANMLMQIRGSVQLKVDQVGLIPFIAELAGTDEVFQYIQALRDDPDLPPGLKSDLDQFERLYEFGAASLSPEVHQRLVRRHQWIAKMALTFGLPSDHPDRASVLKPAKRTFIAAFILMGFVFVGGLTGFVLFVVSMVMVVKKRLRFAFAMEQTPVPEKSYILLEMAVVILAMVLLMGLIGRYLPRPVFWCLYIAMMVISLLWPLWRGMGFGPMRQAVGWHRGKGIFRETGAGIVGYLAGLPLVGCGILVTFWIIKKTDASPVHPIVHQFDDASMLGMIGLVALASVVAPILEETLFRGALYRHLRFRHSALWSALSTGIVFAVIHPQGLAAVPVLGAIGAVFALIREWRGSLIASMVAHGLNNLLITLLLVFALMG